MYVSSALPVSHNYISVVGGVISFLQIRRKHEKKEIERERESQNLEGKRYMPIYSLWTLCVKVELVNET